MVFAVAVDSVHTQAQSIPLDVDYEELKTNYFYMMQKCICFDYMLNRF